MPDPTLDDQGNTYRCGAFAVRQWFEGYGYAVGDTQAFAKYAALADSQQGLSFEQVHDYAGELASEVGASLEWCGDGYLRDFPTFDQTVHDKWCVVIGVQEADLKPGQNYYHYIDVDGLSGAEFDIKDSYHVHDGEQGQEPVDKVHQAIQDNWDAVLCGLAFQITSRSWPAAPPVSLTPDAQAVTIFSVIHDSSKDAGIQQLCVQGKALFGA